MLIDTEGQPRECWGVKVRGDAQLALAYICETEAQANQLASEHRKHFNARVVVVPLVLTVTEKTRT